MVVVRATVVLCSKGCLVFLLSFSPSNWKLYPRGSLLALGSSMQACMWGSGGATLQGETLAEWLWSQVLVMCMVLLGPGWVMVSPASWDYISHLHRATVEWTIGTSPSWSKSQQRTACVFHSGSYGYPHWKQGLLDLFYDVFPRKGGGNHGLR